MPEVRITYNRNDVDPQMFDVEILHSPGLNEREISLVLDVAKHYVMSNMVDLTQLKDIREIV